MRHTDTTCTCAYFYICACCELAADNWQRQKCESHRYCQLVAGLRCAWLHPPHPAPTPALLQVTVNPPPLCQDALGALGIWHILEGEADPPAAAASGSWAEQPPVATDSSHPMPVLVGPGFHLVNQPLATLSNDDN